MSVYTFLSMPVPTIAYCALHQSAPGITRDEYASTMREFHERLRRESSILSSGYERFLIDNAAKELHALGASINEFLQTPLRPDEDEVRRRIQESFRRVGDLYADSPGPVLIRSSEGEVVEKVSGSVEVKKVLEGGREFLKGLGFSTGKGKGNVFESVFVVHGGRSLDLLEHLVRDVLGIYSTTHGKHIKEFGNYAYTAYNLENDTQEGE